MVKEIQSRAGPVFFWGPGQNPNWRPQININIQLVYMSCKVYFDASQKIHMVKTVIYKYIKL